MITRNAYAKLNLTLDVLGRRADGYHDLQMVMHSVSLHDTLTLRLVPGGSWALRCVDADGILLPEVPQDGRNLVWRAAEQFFRRTGLPAPGVQMELVKRIPSQAGLGGGSADAAAMLHALNEHYNSPLPLQQLCALGAEVGSDVPFCVLGGTAVACGRGEVLTPVPGVAPLHVVIVKPEFGISTPELFASFDRWHDGAHPDDGALLDALRAGKPEQAGALLCNVLQPVAERQHPQLAQLRQALLDAGACGACMTGSGSAVFGLFRTEQEARAAVTRLEPQKLGKIFRVCSIDSV